MRFKKYISLCLMAVVVTTLVACGNKEKTTSSTSVDTESSTQKTTTSQNDTTKDILKNTVIEGNLTDAEKAKVVELTDKITKVAINFDYTKDSLDTVKEFFKYTTDNVSKEFSDKTLQEMFDGQVATKEIVSVEGVTYNKLSKDSEGKITVDITINEKIVNHTNPKLSGKNFSNTKITYVFDKDYKVSAFKIGQIE